MKKTFSILTLFIGFYIGSFLIIACNDDCGVSASNTRLKSMSLQFQKILGTNTSENGFNNYNIAAYNSDSIGIRYDSIGIDITNEIETYSNNLKTDFIGMAYACEPVVNFSRIKNIEIISDQNYNDTHPKGNNLKNIVNIRNGYSVGVSSYEEIFGGNIFINFNAAPTNNNSHIITISLELEDGRTFSSILPSIKIRKQ